MTSNVVYNRLPPDQPTEGHLLKTDGFNQTAEALGNFLAEAGISPSRPGWQDKVADDGPAHNPEPWALAFPEGSSDPFIAKYLQQRVDAQRDLGLTGDELLDRVVRSIHHEQQEIKIETTPEVIDQIRQLIAAYDKVEHTKVIEPVMVTLPQIDAFEKEIIEEVRDSYLSEALDGAKIRSQAKDDAELVLGKPDPQEAGVDAPAEKAPTKQSTKRSK